MTPLRQKMIKVAIANSRLVALDDGMVTLRYKDRKNNRLKHNTISAVEFIRRFLLHTLPKGFVRIRHYGFLANRPWRCCETVQNAHILRVCSAFSPFRAPGGGISQSSTCALNSNLIFEIGSNNKLNCCGLLMLSSTSMFGLNF